MKFCRLTLVNNVVCCLVCSYEIRELEAKLRAGYMNKERAAQLMEKEVIKKEEEVSQSDDCRNCHLSMS